MIKSYEGTLAGVAVPLTLDGRIRSVSIKNDDAANTYTCTIGGETITVQAGETRGFSLGDDQYGLLTINGTGDYRILASDNDVPPVLIESTSVVVDGAITTAKLANGVLSADAAGRAKMADDYFTSVEVSTAGAGGKFDANCITAAGLQHLCVDDVLDNTRVQALFAAGAFGTDADSRAAFATDFFNAATVLSKFATDSFDAANVADIIAAKAIPATKIEDGSATLGLDATDVRFLQTVVGGGALSVSGTPELIFAVTVPNLGGNLDFSIGPQKIRITGVEFNYTATGAGGDTFQLQTAAGALNITDAIAGSAVAGAVVRASSLANTTVAAGAGLRLAVNDAGADCSGTLLIRCVPVA